MWRMMIRPLFEKSGSLDSNQKHRSTSENNLSSLVSGLYSARSRGTRAKYLSLFHKSIFLSAYCSTQDVGDLFQFEGPCFFRWFQIWCCWNEKDEERTRNIRLQVWPSMRETRRDVCHSSNATINDLRWLRSRVYSSSTPAALENQTALSQHAAGHIHLFPSCRWRFIYFVISHRKIFFLRFVPQPKIPKGSPQHDVSRVTRTHLMFPSIFLCVFACMRFGLGGFWLFLFRNDDLWLKDHLGLRG